MTETTETAETQATPEVEPAKPARMTEDEMSELHRLAFNYRNARPYSEAVAAYSALEAYVAALARHGVAVGVVGRARHFATGKLRVAPQLHVAYKDLPLGTVLYAKLEEMP